MTLDTNPITGAVADQPGIFRAVLDGVVAFVGILTPTGILTEANELALDAAGLDREQVVGKPFWDCYWWNFDAGVQDGLRKAVACAAAGEKVRYDVEIRVAGDARMVIDFQIVPHFDGHGRVDFLISSGVDITVRKRHETVLQVARDSFQKLVSQSPFGIYAVDADFRLSMVSAGALKVFSSVRPLIGRNFAEVLRVIWPEPFASEAIGRFRHTLATGEAYHAPGTVEKRNDIDGIESYDWKIEQMQLTDGRPGVVCHFYDLSKHEEYETALRASEARFRAAFDNAAVGMAHVARGGGWLRVNPRLCDIVGYPEAELRNLTFQDITHPDDLAEDLEHVRQLAAGEIEDYQMDKRYQRKDGTFVWAKLTVSCMRLIDRTIDYFIVVVEDISAQKAAENRQKLLVGELNHRVKNSLATIQAMASHTMRSSGDMDTFRERFAARLRGMAAAHDSIFESGTMQADISSVIRNQLEPYAAAGTDRLHLSGPALRLSANSVHALGLILHELVTNASKYGALSNDAGYVAVSWEPVSKAGRRAARMTWQEVGGPRVTAPEIIGFGTRLVESTLQHSLQGAAEVNFRPEGLVIEMHFLVDEPDAD